MAWSPKFTLDLQTASSNAFDKTIEDFAVWRKTEKPRKLELENGWVTITPQDAEGMLLRNNGNRKPTLSTVKYYARQMLGNVWMKTGEPVIFDSEGNLLDAGHRLWASYLSGASFDTYLVCDVPPNAQLFAYIDNGKARTASDALATAGLNGLSKQLASVVNMAVHFEHGCFTTSMKRPLERMSPVEVLHYAQANDNLRLAVRLMSGEHKAATKLLLHKDVAGFLAFQIIERHGEEVLDEFMSDLGRVGEDEHAENSPIAALQKVLEDDTHSAEPMKKHQVLGHAIKAFNAYVMGEQVKKLTLRVNEAYPRFVPPAPTQQAAE